MEGKSFVAGKPSKSCAYGYIYTELRKVCLLFVRHTRQPTTAPINTMYRKSVGNNISSWDSPSPVMSGLFGVGVGIGTVVCVGLVVCVGSVVCVEGGSWVGRSEPSEQHIRSRYEGLSHLAV